jgi:beta-alanine degradation protein BauB
MSKLLTACLLPVLAAAQGGRPAPVENARVRVVDALDQPHARGAMHEHKVNRVMVYLTKCDIRITAAGGAVDEQHWKPGDVAWSPARGPHTSENTDDAACRIIEIELKPAPGAKPVPAGPLDPVAVDPRHYTVLFDNQEVRVLRAHYAAHETGATHEHTRDRVTVALTDTDMKITTPDGNSQVRRFQRGDTGWGGPAKHQEYNSSDGPFEIIAVELKNQ